MIATIASSTTYTNCVIDVLPNKGAKYHPTHWRYPNMCLSIIA
ncbi:hypothetical protein SJAG_05255 [Schizosaccharomyces japonicus yFS275]|uniref:Uncharacterized protein n=1 Tax=Schizosaccharomyces japonicus (strain yFS275 / FY16936) TaxID=402676 RepID=B6K1L9_SCHJY|nr:hypothetical protein SJAG_05255 [Schizosaccharomyces japonicus yFS275]EEB07050.1 hypothetical protein SJAG_05255 [Schizosaccharomyces japonicus yFS275]